MKKAIKAILFKFPVLEYKIRYLKYLLFVRKNERMTIENKQKYLNKKYKNIFNREINWKEPMTFTEKIQYCKLFETTEMNKKKAKLTDKYLVRKWIADIIGEEYLIPLLGVYDSFDEIDTNSLPNSFVIKCNHDCGSTVLVDDKNKINWKQLNRKYNYLMKIDFSLYLFETHYHYINPKIIIEKDMRVSKEDIFDYKILCFYGKAKYCWVDVDRYEDHKRNIYDLDWNLQKWNSAFFEYCNTPVNRPLNFDKMVEIAEKLSSGFDHVRVDLYNINGKIYFGEMTFTSGGGFENLNPDSADYMLGELWGEVN